MRNNFVSENIIEIDLGALRHNYQTVQKLLSPRQKIMAMVKADAYGHGMVPVSRELERLGCSVLGVFNLEEGVALREAGTKVPIVVLKGISAGQCSECLNLGLIPVVYDEETARRLHQQGLERGIKVRAHLKFDTGMGRLGVPYTEASEFLELIQKLEGVEVDGILTHLAQAGNNGYTHLQLERFSLIMDLARAMGFQLKNNHVSNSMAIMANVAEGISLVRPGILLYGSMPHQYPKKLGLDVKPVMKFSSRIIQVKRVPEKSSISYDRTYVTGKPSIIATIPVGYDNGYSRLMSNSAQVLVRGERAPVVGRVCMNLTMVDVSDQPDVSVGDEVVLLGRQGEGEITANELAAKAQTISYEIFCSLGSRNRRVYINGSD
jgi:alanine racemase